MDIAERIKQERGQDTIAGILPGAASATVTDVASSFGLLDSPECYEEIDAVEAAKVIENVLYRDMAYNTQIMPFSLDRELSGEFVAAFAGSDARFFTNGEWGRSMGALGVGWTPVTSATFDTGVLVVSDQAVGCVWCMDED
ncbi:hypothetical protein [Stenotrophomonas sp. YIM B13575]|uniref:hypothetical protein n=1 Tax=Stenotrophomonas sp. YIM B13575 TaxID=3366314 RepID=UPI0032012341